MNKHHIFQYIVSLQQIIIYSVADIEKEIILLMHRKDRHGRIIILPSMLLVCSIPNLYEDSPGTSCSSCNYCTWQMDMKKRISCPL